MGATLEAADGPLPAVHRHAARACAAIAYELPVASAQVKSCVLLAGLLADGRDDGHRAGAQPRPHRADARRAPASPSHRDGRSRDRRQRRRARCSTTSYVPGDPSSAAFVIAAGVLVPGSRLLVRDWRRTGRDGLPAHRRSGWAAIVLGDLEERPGDEVARSEPVARPRRRRRAARRHGGRAPTRCRWPSTSCRSWRCSAASPRARPSSAARDELRVKESDRITAVVDGLRGLGADIEATEDGFAVEGTGGLRGGVLDARGDHRLAMLGAVAGLASREGVEVVGMEAAAVSYPRFTDDLARLLER